MIFVTITSDHLLQLIVSTDWDSAETYCKETGGQLMGLYVGERN